MQQELDFSLGGEDLEFLRRHEVPSREEKRFARSFEFEKVDEEGVLEENPYYYEPSEWELENLSEMNQILRIEGGIPGLGAGAMRKANALEERLRKMVEEGRSEEILSTIYENMGEAIAMASGFIPKKAERELAVQRKLLWPGGSGFLRMWDFERARAFSSKRWAKENQVLDAKEKDLHEVWKEYKESIEERYGRSFASREDFSAMLGLYEGREKLIEDFERLGGFIDQTERYRVLERKGDIPGIQEVRGLWEKEAFSRSLKVAERILELMKDVAKPAELFVRSTKHWQGSGSNQEEWVSKRLGGIRDWTNHTVKLDDRHSYSHRGPKNEDQLKYLSDILISSVSGALSFDRALAIASPRYAEEAGFEVERFWNNHVPDEIEEIAYKTLKERYEDRIPGDSASRFMNWYSKLILARWVSVGQDHESLIEHWSPDYLDRRIMSPFWMIREGRSCNQYDHETHTANRYPGILEAMLKDGLIREDQIDPPLRNHYPGPRDVLTHPASKLLTQGKVDKEARKVIGRMVSSMRTHERAIETGGETRLLLGSGMEDDLDPLREILDPSLTYTVLFRGNHSLFITPETYFPNGEACLKEIYRFTLVPQGSDHQEGEVVTIDGHRFNIRKQKDIKTERNIRDSIFDSNSDSLESSSYIGVVGVSPQEFRGKYYTDFVAHALIHRGSFGSPETLKTDIDRICAMEDPFLQMSIGPTGRSSLKTFDLGGNFGFMVNNERSAMAGEGAFVFNTLISYVRDLGIPVHSEENLGEEGRAALKNKLEDRKFAEQHLEGIISDLQEEGLPGVLSFLLNTKEYGIRDFGKSITPCEECGRDYISGEITKVEWNQFDGIRARELHELAHHPQTFRFHRKNLYQIKELLSEAESHTPTFIQYPELITEMREFARLDSEFIEADSDDFNFWYSTGGGIDQYDEEEIEDDPGLEKLAEEKKEIVRRMAEYGERSGKAVERLQMKYNSLRGASPEEGVGKMETVSFWRDQVMIYSIYKLEGEGVLAKRLGEDSVDFEPVSWNYSRSAC